MTTQIELRQVPLPARTDSYTPVPHGVFIDTILEAAYKRDFTLVRDNWNEARNGQVMSGKLVFAGEEPGMDMQIGLANSYDKSKAAVIAMGAEVFICLNGCISAEYSMRRKHTTNVWEDLTNMIEEGTAILYDEYYKILKAKNRFTEIDLNKRAQAELLCRLFVEEEIVTPTMANIVKKEIQESKLFPADNLWSFYNHVTHALKQSHPLEYIDMHVKLHSFVEHSFK